MTAPGYGCADDECRNPVNWLLTHMKPPGTLSVCDEHFAVFAIGLLAGDLGVDNARLYDVIRKHVDREAAKAAKAAAAEQAAQAQAAQVNGEQAAGPPDTGLLDAVRAEYHIPPADVPAGGEQS